MTPLDNFYSRQREPVRGVYLALREIILNVDPEISNELKYGMPFFSYKGKMFCYLWFHKKHEQPYIGIVEGKSFDEPFLIQEKRSRMKIMLIDADKDLPVKRIRSIVNKAIDLYKKGTIKVPRKKVN